MYEEFWYSKWKLKGFFAKRIKKKINYVYVSTQLPWLKNGTTIKHLFKCFTTMAILIQETIHVTLFFVTKVMLLNKVHYKSQLYEVKKYSIF